MMHDVTHWHVTWLIDMFEKPLDMLLEEELEMWKEKENDSMDEGAQEDEQVEIEIDNRKTVGSEVFPRKMADVLKMFATNPIR